MTTINTTLFVFICIFAGLGALVALLIFIMLSALIICGIISCIEDSKKEEENKCPYEVEGETKND